MYNKLLNYFENECCISNIFMQKHWLAWYITMGTMLAIAVVYSYVANLWIRYIVTIGVNLLILGSLMITFYKLFCEEVRKELKKTKLYLNVREILQKYRRDPVYFEFQLSKMKKYCKENNLSIEEIQKFIQYIDEDLNKKSPKDRKREMFLSMIVPSIISIVTVYTTNNQIKEIQNIIGITITYIFIAYIISIVLYAILDIDKVIVDRRRNLLELKDILRNIDMDQVMEEKKIIV